MSLDLGKLASQGRAFNGSRPWSEAELDALLLIERERKVQRTIAADYIRNGIVTLQAYDAAVKANFKPKTAADAVKAAEAALKDNEFAVGASEQEAPKAKETEEKAPETPPAGKVKGGKK